MNDANKLGIIFNMDKTTGYINTTGDENINGPIL